MIEGLDVLIEQWKDKKLELLPLEQDSEASRLHGAMQLLSFKYFGRHLRDLSDQEIFQLADYCALEQIEREEREREK